METDWTARKLPIIAGHLALDFANTVDDPEGPERWDHIATEEALSHWASRVGLPGEGQTANGDMELCPYTPLSAAHELRSVLNEVFGAVADGDAVSNGSWRRLRPFVSEAHSSAQLIQTDSPHGPYSLDWAHLAGVRAVLDPVAAAASQLLISDDCSRLKRCARCPWLFLDYSKNHSRRWCDMDDCGRAEKIERYIARRAARREARADNQHS